MFDFSRFTETISGLVGSIGSDAVAQAQGLPEVLQNVGLDPSILTGLSETEIGSLLASYGVDISQFAEGELSQFVEGLGLTEGTEQLSSLWSSFADNR
jgi:hypothetical protein